MNYSKNNKPEGKEEDEEFSEKKVKVWVWLET